MRSLARIKKLEKAHSSLLNEQNEKEHVITCGVGLTCDIIDESFYNPIVAPANPFCSSSSTTTSLMSDGFTCDASLMVENETLKMEVNELTRDLGNVYGGEARLLKCLGSQRFSLNKEGLDFTVTPQVFSSIISLHYMSISMHHCMLFHMVATNVICF
jgi:hypothetical protein